MGVTVKSHSKLQADEDKRQVTKCANINYIIVFVKLF